MFAFFFFPGGSFCLGFHLSFFLLSFSRLTLRCRNSVKYRQADNIPTDLQIHPGCRESDSGIQFSSRSVCLEQYITIPSLFLFQSVPVCILACASPPRSHLHSQDSCNRVSSTLGRGCIFPPPHTLPNPHGLTDSTLQTHQPSTPSLQLAFPTPLRCACVNSRFQV